MSGRQAWPCWRCYVVKPREDFPVGRSGKRRTSVCMTCVEVEAHATHERLERWRATWVDPKTGIVMRRCPACGEVKQLERDYYAAPKALPGSRWPTNLPCKVCKDAYSRARYHKPERIEKERAYSRAASKRYLARHPGRKTEINRKRWEKVKADPKLLEHVRETARINRRLRLEREGKALESPRKAPRRRGTVRVPGEPLARLIDRLTDQRKAVEGVMAEGGKATLGAVCHDLGVSDRRYREWRKGSGADIASAERVLMNAGVEWHEVYSYDDHAAAFLAHEVEV